MSVIPMKDYKDAREQEVLQAIDAAMQAWAAPEPLTPRQLDVLDAQRELELLAMEFGHGLRWLAVICTNLADIEEGTL